MTPALRIAAVVLGCTLAVGAVHAQDTGASSERTRLAVLDFALDEIHLYGTGGGREQRSGGTTVKSGIDVDYDLIRNLQDRFRARIEELLIHSRRFAVLDRRAGEIYEQEKRLLASDDVNPNEAARLGKVLGADFMLYGTVDRIEVTEERRTIVLTGETSTEVAVTARLRYSLLTVATREIGWASSLELQYGVDEELRTEQAAEMLLDRLALFVAEEVTDSIFPPKVAQVTGVGSFVVNRGGNTVSEGDLFEVFALGDMIVDPDTGEDLGQLETMAGIARITSVKPKFSLAEMVTEHGEIVRGMILRRFHGLLGKPEGSDSQADQPGTEGERNYRRIDTDGDGDGMPDYLNRDASTGDSDGDGIPDYLNRDNLRRR
jgi:hypothetical protein